MLAAQLSGWCAATSRILDCCVPPEVLREALSAAHMIFPPTQIPHNPPSFHGVSSNVKHVCQVEVLNIRRVEKVCQVFPDTCPQKFVSETGLFFFLWVWKSRRLFSLQEDVDAFLNAVFSSHAATCTFKSSILEENTSRVRVQGSETTFRCINKNKTRHFVGLYSEITWKCFSSGWIWNKYPTKEMLERLYEVHDPSWFWNYGGNQSSSVKLA